MDDLGGTNDIEEVVEEVMCDLEIERDDYNDRIVKFKQRRTSWRGKKDRKKEKM